MCYFVENLEVFERRMCFGRLLMNVGSAFGICICVFTAVFSSMVATGTLICNSFPLFCTLYLGLYKEIREAVIIDPSLGIVKKN